MKKCLMLGIAVCLVLLNTGFSLAQEGTTAEQAPKPTTEQAPETTTEQASASVEPEIQWLWGEVLSVDATNKTILLKTLDYETDSEKEISMNIDDKTTYENVNALDQIKPQDTVSIDYIVTTEGKNIAKNISVEKPEGTQRAQEETIPETTIETNPEDLQPATQPQE